jgi:glycosyltransferase involved in cell wall biosynthesis
MTIYVDKELSVIGNWFARGFKMRIAWVDNAVSWGGVEVHVAMLARMAVSAGHEGLILCDSVLASRYEKALEGSGVQVVSGSWNRILSFKSIFSMVSVLRTYQPSVVHSHLYWATRIAAPAAYLANVPLMVETIHLEESWRSGWRRILSLADGIIARMFVNRHIAVSNSVANSSIKTRRIASEKVVTIPNSVHPEKSRTVHRESYSLAFLGRLEHQKGLDVLIESLKILHDRKVLFDMRIGGIGTLRKKLEEKVFEYGLNGCVHFVGQVDDRASFFSDRSIMVLPSRYEGFPMVLLECAWHHQCVVASNVSGIPELIINNESGLLCPAEDAIQLAETLERAINERELREHCAVNLRDKVESEYSPQIFLQKTLEALA